MNVIDAAHLTVLSYPGGSESLSPRVGISAGVLRNKVNPNSDSHHLTLAEADLLMAVTGDHRILHALAANHGYALSAVGESQGVGGLLQAITGSNAAEGDFDRCLDEALADGQITQNELRRLTDLAIAQQGAMTRLVARLAAAAAQPPSTPAEPEPSLSGARGSAGAARRRTAARKPD